MRLDDEIATIRLSVPHLRRLAFLKLKGVYQIRLSMN